MKAPHNNQLTPGVDYQTAPIEIAARDVMRHAVIEIERASGGDPARRARMLFDQAQVMTRAGVLLAAAAVAPVAIAPKADE